MANKYYAVKNGICSGIYRTWDECKKNVDGYSGAIYKSFKTLEEAEAFMEGANQVKKVIEDKPKTVRLETTDVKLYVDGSFMTGSEDYVGCGMVLLINGQELRKSERLEDADIVTMRQIGGEINATMIGIEKAISLGMKSIEILYDYIGIECWATGEWRAKNFYTKDYVNKMKAYSDVIDITFTHVKAHTGNYYNEIADKLAKEAVEVGSSEWKEVY